jgi:HK97 family phage prohead protease
VTAEGGFEYASLDRARPTQVAPVHRAIRAEGPRERFAIFSGYATVFNRDSSILRDKTTGSRFIERIEPGAFHDVLASARDVGFQLFHEGRTLASRTDGTLLLAENSTGLRFAAAVDADDENVAMAVRSLRAGGLRGTSFSFLSDPHAEGREWSGNVERRVVRRVATVGHIAVVWDSAYRDARVQRCDVGIYRLGDLRRRLRLELLDQSVA